MKTNKKPKRSKTYLKQNKQTGLYNGCKKLAAADASNYPFMKSPAQVPRNKLSKGLRAMVDQMCLMQPDHLATHAFLRALTGRERTTVYRYINEGRDKGVIVRYKLIASCGRQYGYAYRPVTYLVPYKGASSKNIGRKNKNAFAVSKQLLKGSTSSTGKGNGSMQNPKNAEPFRVQRTPKSSTRGLLEEDKSSSDSSLTLVAKDAIKVKNNNSANATEDTSPSTSRKRTGRSKADCIELCHTKYKSITDKLLAISGEQSLPGAIARSVIYYIESNPVLSESRLKQVEYLVRTEVIPKPTLEDLVRKFNSILLQPNARQSLDCDIVNEMRRSKHLFPILERTEVCPECPFGSNHYGYVRDLGCKSPKDVLSLLTTHSALSAYLHPTRMLIALRAEGKIHLFPDELFPASPFEGLFYAEWLWLFGEYEKDPEGFERDFRFEVPYTKASLLESERRRAEGAFDALGMSLGYIEEKLASLSEPRHFDLDYATGLLAPHLNYPY